MQPCGLQLENVGEIPVGWTWLASIVAFWTPVAAILWWGMQ
jgi:hypothetical protein